MSSAQQLNIEWICKPFALLTPFELYDVLQLRSQVFVVEQQCVFLDMDSKDQQCHHLLGYHNQQLIASVRLLPPGLAYNYMSIGRVVNAASVRGKGAGRQLIIQAIHQCQQLFGKGSIKIGAQLYLKKFYESFGFEQCGDVYDEDGIDHIPMLRL